MCKSTSENFDRVRASPAEASKLRPSNIIYMSNSKKIEVQKYISTPAAN
jgi:hypothetical protein